jgi:HSP20 family protein
VTTQNAETSQTTENSQRTESAQNAPNTSDAQSAQNTQNVQDGAQTGSGNQMAPTRKGGAEGQQEQRAQLARWSPLALLEEFQDELARLWSRPFGAQLARPSRLLAQLPMGVPRLDMFEQDGYLIVKAEVPGVKKEDLQVELEDGDLVIQGETRAENEASDDQYYRMERRYGRFYRRVALPFDVNPDDIQATMNDGVLEVRIPKPPETKSPGRQIPVR